MSTETDRSKTTLGQVIRGKQTPAPAESVVRTPPRRADVTAATVAAMDEPQPVSGAGNSAATKPRVAAANDAGRMDAVVDLLFGSHLNDINTNMRNLEKQLSKRVDKVEGEMRVRMESMDRHAKAEMDSLAKLIEKEQFKREGEIKDMGDRIDAAVRQFEVRIEKIESGFARTHEITQKDLDERLAKAADATAVLRKGMEQEIASMKVSLSTRTELSTMFGELSKRLEANASGGGR